jgi:predicted dithiol-disulfide oxidoreductase (DUF899 family)
MKPAHVVEATAQVRHATGTRAEWLEARRALLAKEKELTRRSDELARERRALPWVRIEKSYRFWTETGSASLEELFRGRTQLLVYHFMFGPEYEAGCTSCSSISDGFDGLAVHLAEKGVTLAAVSRAPIEKLLAYRRRMGWKFPWASSFGSDFNFDFGVSFTEAQQTDGDIDYNYRREPAWPVRDGEGIASRMRGTPVGDAAARSGTDVATYARERPGMSAFALQDGAIHHTYSCFARGLDALWGIYAWLDRAPLGRNESGYWLRRRDEYGAPQGEGCAGCA